MSVRKPHIGALTGAAAILVLSVAALATPAAEPAAAAGLVSKPLPAEQQNLLEAQAAAAQADEAATRRMRAEIEAQKAEERRIAAEQAAKAAEQAAAAAAAAEQAAAREQLLTAATSDPKSVARHLLAERGMGEDQFACLDKLWEKESNWQVTADNPTSSAYGIPQALPGHKMASAGADWETNPATQITWGLEYIGDRYGTPCKAWNHSQAVNWY